jgi:hypothetical protein
MPCGMLKAIADRPVLSRSTFSIQPLDQRRIIRAGKVEEQPIDPLLNHVMIQ